jgi:hypothetical protein
MKRLGFLALSALLSFHAYGDVKNPDFGVFCDQLLQVQPSISDYSTYFTKDFQSKVPLEYLKSIFSDLYSEIGKCESYTTTPNGSGKYLLVLKGAKGLNALFSVVVDQSTGLFNGLLLDGEEDPSVQIQTWNDVGPALRKLDQVGKLSATLVTADKSVFLSENDKDVFAIGSTFKLYILGALEQSIEKGLHSWDEILPIKEEWKSLPSGIMHTWPAGKEVKLLEYAQNMISISDNTATDHLLYLLGRNEVEAMLAPMNNHHESAYLPFLSTLEMFKLKWAIEPAETASYLASSAADRLSFLDTLKQVPRSAVGTNGVPLDKPTLIDQLEWYASTPETCEAMFWLADRKSPEIRQVLSKSVPFIGDAGQSSSHWAYAGYKGGSEPGVISMTFLLESKKGTRGCLAVSWNNSNGPVAEYRFMDVVKKMLKYAEQQIP